MPSVARIRHLRRALAQRLERLGETLEELTERVHEAVAQAVAQAVSAAVRDTILTLLAAATDDRGPSPIQRWPPEPYRSAWPQRRDPRYGDRADADPSAGWWTDEEPEYEEHGPSRSDDTEASPPRWRCALALGCRATAWWLPRWSGRRPLFAALAVGVASAAAAYAAGAGLAYAALRWVALAGALGSGAWVLGQAGST
jgi:hypothetical protein